MTAIGRGYDARATRERWAGVRAAATEYARETGLPAGPAGPALDRDFLLGPPLSWPTGWVDVVVGPARFGSMLVSGRWCVSWRALDPGMADPARWIGAARDWPAALEQARDAAALGRHDRQAYAELVTRLGIDGGAASRAVAAALRAALPREHHLEATRRAIREGETRAVRGLGPDDWLALVGIEAQLEFWRDAADPTPTGADDEWPALCAAAAEAVAREECDAALAWLARADVAAPGRPGAFARALRAATIRAEPWSPAMLGRLAGHLVAPGDLAAAAGARLAALADPRPSRATRAAVAGAGPAAWGAIRAAGVGPGALAALIGPDRLADWVPSTLAAGAHAADVSLALELAGAAPLAVADRWAAALARGDLAAGRALLAWCERPRSRREGLATLRRRLYYELERPTEVGSLADAALASLGRTTRAP